MKSSALATSKRTELAAANRINEAHRNAISVAAKAMMTGIERAIEVGRLLVEEKARHEHGEWIPWIDRNLDFDRMQAARYMRAFDNRDELQKKLSNETHGDSFGLKGALRLLAKPREKKPKRRESLDASVEVEDSDEDVDDTEDADTFGADAGDDDSYLAAYLIRADQAARFAVYKGPVSKDVIAMARRVADAWTKLADDMENQ